MENYIPGVYVQLNHGKRESRDTVDIFFHLLPVTGFSLCQGSLQKESDYLLLTQKDYFTSEEHFSGDLKISGIQSVGINT